MAQAKQCDRCEKLYTIHTKDMPYALMKEQEILDLCPDCAYELEDFVDNPNKYKKGKNSRKPWLEEAKEKASERMFKRAAAAKEVQKKEGITYREAFSKSSKNFEDIPKDDEGKTHKDKQPNTYRCTMCGRGKFEEPHQICEDCQEMFPDQSKKQE